MKGIFITKFLMKRLNNFSYELNSIDRESECNTFIHNTKIYNYTIINISNTVKYILNT